MNTPSIGRIVRYVSHGTPVHEDGSQAYASQSRVAVITEVGDVTQGGDGNVVGLLVINPTGLFFHALADGGVPFDASGTRPGTWYWPEVTVRATLADPEPADGARA